MGTVQGLHFSHFLFSWYSKKQKIKQANQQTKYDAIENNMPQKKKKTPVRSFKVCDQIQRDLSELIARELKDPRVGMVTIQAVEITPDYAHANIHFSVLVGDKKACEVALNQAAGFLRNGLFKRLHIHTVPTLHFIFDRTTEKAASMNALIAQAVATQIKE